MPESKPSSDNGANKTEKRCLPSWVSERENGSKACGRTSVDVGVREQTEQSKKPEQAKGSGGKSNKRPAASNLSTELNQDGVVFVLSGFVNPERSTLRSQALEMEQNIRLTGTQIAHS